MATPRSQNGFIFMNASGSSFPDIKASTTARAFVARNARATHRLPIRRSREWPLQDAVATTEARSTAAHYQDGEHSACNRGGTEENGDGSQEWLSSMEVVLQGEVSVARATRQPKKLLCPCCRQWKFHRKNSRETQSGLVCESCRSVQWRHSAGPKTTVNGKVDPFSCVAVDIDGKSKILWTYFLSAISPNLMPIPSSSPTSTTEDINQYWLSPSLKQPAFAHSILCLTALQLVLVEPDMQPSLATMAAYHRVKAINAVHEALSDSEQALSDETIAAVFGLLCFEENLFIPQLPISHMHPSMAQRTAHARGLREMIRRRGGIQGLSGTTGRLLQLFIVRHSVAHVATSFKSSYRLPVNLVQKLYNYPASSRFCDDPAPVSRRCQVAGMDNMLTHLVRCVECLMKDTELYSQNPQGSHYHSHDVQLLFVALIGQLWGWYMEADESGRLSAAEGLVTFSISYLMSIVYRSKFTATSSAREMALSRISRHLEDHKAIETLQAAGLDVWVAMSLVIMAIERFRDQFWGFWFETLTKQKDRPLESFEDLKRFLEKGIWLPSSHDMYARCVWDETIQIRALSSGSFRANDPETQQPHRVISSVASRTTSSNPYVNYQSLSWTPMDENESEYAL